MNATARTLVGFAAVLVAASALAATSTVTPIGQDGPAAYHRVSCATGASASIEVRTESRSVCLSAAHLKRTCRPGWSVDAAADYACRTATAQAR
jgi:hypothetical protein